MFPDFPRPKRRLQLNLIRFLESQIRIEEPVLGEVSRFTQHEGDHASIERPDGSSEEIDFKLLSNEFGIHHEDIKTGNLEKVYECLFQTARKFACSQVSHMISQINEATHQTGNVVQVRGTISREDYLAALSMVPVDFDPETLQPLDHRKFLASRDQVRELRRLVREWCADPGFKAALSAITERQRAEWHDRESNRKLVD